MSIIGAGRQSSSSAIRKLRGHSFSGTDVFTYKESLDTTYVGGYIGFGGEYSLGFLSTGGLMNRLGLRTFINAKAGLYNADMAPRAARRASTTTALLPRAPCLG